MNTESVSLYTIGAFGYTESGFFGALQGAGIDTFCDIRRRRGVRGAEFAFVNATRLQLKLATLGIRYFHALELAPPNELRAVQAAADKVSKIAKRQRTGLSPEFKEAYRRECLAGFDSRAFLEGLGPAARRIALFCVEREPAACHRSLVAGRINDDLGVSVTHLKP